MFNNSNTTPTGSGAGKLFTGLTAFKVLAVNPSKEQIETFLNREYKLNVDYSIVNLNGRNFRPIEIWLQDVGSEIAPTPMRFLVSNEDDISPSGTIRFVNEKGVFTLSKTADLKSNEKLGWFTKHDYRIAKIGENELFTFMQKLMRYNSYNDDARFLSDTVTNNITIEALYNNDLTGLRKFFEWCSGNDNSIVLIAAVRSTSKMVNDETKVYYNQTIVNNPNAFFMTSNKEVSAKSVQAVNEMLSKGDKISKYLFTVLFQPFELNECVNAVPQTTATTNFDPKALF